MLSKSHPSVQDRIESRMEASPSIKGSAPFSPDPVKKGSDPFMRVTVPRAPSSVTPSAATRMKCIRRYTPRR